MVVNYFFGMNDRRKVFSIIYQSAPLSLALVIVNIKHAMYRIWICAEFTYSKLTIETLEQSCETCSMLTLNIFHTFVLVFLLLTLNM